MIIVIINTTTIIITITIIIIIIITIVIAIITTTITTLVCCYYSSHDYIIFYCESDYDCDFTKESNLALALIEFGVYNHKFRNLFSELSLLGSPALLSCGFGVFFFSGCLSKTGKLQTVKGLIEGLRL